VDLKPILESLIAIVEWQTIESMRRRCLKQSDLINPKTGIKIKSKVRFHMKRTLLMSQRIAKFKITSCCASWPFLRTEVATDGANPALWSLVLLQRLGRRSGRMIGRRNWSFSEWRTLRAGRIYGQHETPLLLPKEKVIRLIQYPSAGCSTLSLYEEYSIASRRK